MAQPDKSKNVEDFYPLSPMQQGMIYHTMLAPGTGIYVEQLWCMLRGPLDLKAFEESWIRVVRRHPILHTSFVMTGVPEPVQVVQRDVQVPFNLLDWTTLQDDVRERQIQVYLANDRSRGFDPGVAPLLRITVVKYNPDHHMFVWTYHHALLDGWSVPLVLNEVFRFYAAITQNRLPVLPPPRSYRDYIVWLRRQSAEKARTFWEHTLRGFRSPTALGVVPPEALAGGASGAMAEEEIWLASEESANLVSFARRHQLTVASIVQAAWGLLLSRYSGDNDVVFGVTVSGRPTDLAGAEEIPGLFINTLPVRVKVDSAAGSIWWLKRVQESLVELRSYEYSPLEEAQRHSSIPPGQPLFHSIVVFENYPVQSAGGEIPGDLHIEAIQSAESTNFPLTIVGGLAGRLMIKAVYDCGLFARPTVVHLLGHLSNLIRELSREPSRPLGLLDEMDEAERATVTMEAEAATSVYKSILEPLQLQVSTHPDAEAISSPNGSLAYGELDKRCNQLAHLLRTMGVGPERMVAICMNPCIELVVAILAVLKAGGAYVPLDPRYPPDRLRFILDDSGANILVTDEALDQTLGFSLPQKILLDREQARIQELPAEAPRPLHGPLNLAYVIYTSGSTGRPKGVMVHHEGLLNLALAIQKRLDLRQGSRVLQFFSFGFDGSVADIFATLAGGGTLCVVPRDVLSSMVDLHTFLRENAVTTMLVTPTVLSSLPTDGLTGIRTVSAGGEKCTGEIVAKWLPGRRFFNLYGPTEATVAACSHELSDAEESLPSVPIGKPLPNLRVYVLDERLRPVPRLVPGELYIAGVGLARGYMGRPDLTADRFLPDPMVEKPGERMYRTGDIARLLPDGTLDFIGRRDFQVKLRGYRIELGEVENVLREHTAINDAVVVTREDSTGAGRLVAYVTLREGGSVDEQGAHEYLRRRLPSYMVPSRVVVLEAFPLNENGKVDRHALPAPDVAGGKGSDSLVEPRNEVERTLVRIWENLLERQPVGVRDDFFALGGHSLLALRLLGDIEKQFGRPFPLVTFFQDPTIAHLASMIGEADDGAPTTPLIELRKGRGRVPLFLVHPTGGSVHWYADLAKSLPADQPVFGLQAVGLQQGGEADKHIEDMAARYVRAATEQWPAGPFYLAGWSFGVIVAYEMAVQLSRIGRLVGFLGLLDQGPTIPIVREPSDSAELLVDVFKGHLDLDLNYLRSLEEDERFSYVLTLAKKENLFPFYIRGKDFKRYMQINHLQTSAWRHYRPEPFTGRITIYRSEEAMASSDTPADFGWSRLALGGVEVVDVPGDHMSMMQKPNVRVLATRIDDALRQATDRVNSVGSTLELTHV